MNRPARIGRTAVGVILWLIASLSLRLGHSDNQFEPAGRAQDHTHQQMTRSGHSPDLRGALKGVLAGTLVLPTPGRDSDKFWSASTPRGSGRAASEYPPTLLRKQVRAGDTTKEPCRAQHWQERTTTETGRRAPHSSGEDIHQPRADVRPTTFYNDGVHPGWPGWPRTPGDPGSHQLRQQGWAAISRPNGVHPGRPGWPRPPRNPGLHLADQRGLDSPWIFDGMHPGRPGWLWPPGNPGLHQLQCHEQAAASRPNGVHPGGPGWPRPARDPGLHQTGQGGLGIPNPRVHPRWPGRPRPPRDPGSHQAEQSGWTAPHPFGGRPGRPAWFRSPRPGPRLSKQGPKDFEANLKAGTHRGIGAGQAAEGESVGCSPSRKGSRTTREEKAGTGSRRRGGPCARTMAELAPRPPSPSSIAPIETSPWGLGPGREYPHQGLNSGPECVKGPCPRRSRFTALYFNGGEALFPCRAVGSTRPVASYGLPCANADSVAVLSTQPPVGTLGISPYGLITGSAPPGSQRALTFFPNNRETDCEPWATHGRGPAVSLDSKQFTNTGNLGTPSPSSRTAAVPIGPPTWKPSWGTTSGLPGSSHPRRRPITSGPPACVLPTTTRKQPCTSGSTDPWVPPRAQGRGKEDRPQRIRRNPRKEHGGNSPRTTPRTSRAAAGGSGHRAAGGPPRRAPGGTAAQEHTTTRTTIALRPGDSARCGTRDRNSATHGIRGRAKGPRERRLAQQGARRVTHGAPTSTSSSTRSPRRSSGARRTASPGRPQPTVVPTLPRATSQPGRHTGGRRRGWRGPTSKRCDSEVGNVETGSVGTPTMPTGPPATSVMRQSQWPSGSSPRTLGRRHASAEPRSSRTSQEPAGCAEAPSCPGGRCGPVQPKVTHPCQPPASVGTCTATRRSRSCSGPKPSSTRPDRRRSPGTGRPPRTCRTWSPTTLTARPSRCPTPRRTQWQKPGGWTTTSSAASSSGTGAAPGATTTPPLFYLWRTDRSQYSSWESPSSQSGRTNASRTTGSWLTGKPSRAYGRPSTGRTPAPKESSTRSGCPPSRPAGLRTGSLGPTSWRRTAGPRSTTGTLRTRRGRRQSPTQEGPRRSCPMGRRSLRCSLGKLLRGWPGSAPTRRPPKEDPCGPWRREPRERSGRPSSRRRASTPPSSTSSRTTGGTRSKG